MFHIFAENTGQRDGTVVIFVTLYIPAIVALDKSLGMVPVL